MDEAGVVAKFGVYPDSIPDFLALVGDSADGYPGLRGWGAKSTSAVLTKYGHIESIPPSARDWHLSVLNSASLADTLIVSASRQSNSSHSMDKIMRAERACRYAPPRVDRARS
jgi:5'-3' exonuclease